MANKKITDLTDSGQPIDDNTLFETAEQTAPSTFLSFKASFSKIKTALRTAFDSVYTLKSTYDAFVAKYPTTATNGKYLQGNGAVYVEVDAVTGVVPNSPITGATKTKITYDTKGLVTIGSDATQDDIGDGTTYKQFSSTEKTKLSKYPSTANNGKILQGDGTNYVEVDMPSGGSINTNYSVLTYASSINIDVSQTVNNKYIEASGNFSIVMTAKPALADGFWGDIHIKKTTASDIVITLDSLVNNVNYSGGTPLPSITISGGLNIEEHLKFSYDKAADKYSWEVLKYRTNHIKDITISTSYTLSIADFDFTKNDQMFFVSASSGSQDFIIPAGLALPAGTNIVVYQVSTVSVLLKKGNTTTVIFNAAGYPNVVASQSTLYLASQNSAANITFKGSDTYFINGDILG